MGIYYITFAIICMFCGIAENQDTPEIDKNQSLRFRHSFITGFFYFTVACWLIFVSGFRYNVGADFGGYYRRYSSYLIDLSDSIRNIDEPGFGIIAWIATRISDTGTSVVLLAAGITILLPFIVIYRHTDQLLLAIVLYFALGCWSGSFNGVRQFLAASVLFCGYISLYNKNIIRYTFVVFIAFLFHRSAIVMIILYFVLHREMNIRNIILLILIVGVSIFSYDRLISLSSIIMDTEYSFSDAYTSRIVNRIRIIATCLPAVVFIFLYRNKELSKEKIFHLNLVIIHAVLCLITMNSALLYRISFYTLLFQTIAIPELLKGIEGNNKKIITAGIVIMFVGMQFYELIHSGSLNNFQWAWNH